MDQREHLPEPRGLATEEPLVGYVVHENPGNDAQPNRMWWLYGIVVLIIACLVSEFAFRPLLSSPQTWSHQIEVLDEKQGNVAALALSATGASAAITLLPGDVGTPIADQLADLASDLVIILAAVFLEKYLLTTLGLVSCGFLVPAGCVLGAIGCYLCLSSERHPIRLSRGHVLNSLARKLIVFGVAIVCIIPASVMLSDAIEATYDEASSTSITQVTQDIDNATNDVSDEAEADTATDNEDGNLWDTVVNGVTGAVDSAVSTLTTGAQDALDRLQSALSQAMEAFAVMVVTSCLIPLLVMLLFFWLTKVITGISIQPPALPQPSQTVYAPSRIKQRVRDARAQSGQPSGPRG